MDAISIQEQLFPTMTCFGCGPANPRGLRLKSYVRDGYVSATFTPWPEHDNGLGLLNGGIIATLLDCHSAAGVLHEASLQGWDAPPGALLPFVTAGIDVRYLRPSPLDSAVDLWAAVTKSAETEIICDVELRYDDKTRATGHAVWKRWRSR
ncbi:PaaI family thioesterase [Mycobacterium sp. Aquia_213]|uniref:PaaI family thioesterase n=1 Tax=Mycobacterium sp. Aquia_213 TaxID=2991728 RepID=UPI00226DF7CD|nr:PaaI family thioesterase [Mycobacterium sp. Aquia_213]WAC91086.1 PaaI family thioesterase [Mycobacterium sp. Aquia_213]